MIQHTHKPPPVIESKHVFFKIHSLGFSKPQKRRQSDELVSFDSQVSAVRRESHSLTHSLYLPFMIDVDNQEPSFSAFLQPIYGRKKKQKEVRRYSIVFSIDFRLVFRFLPRLFTDFLLITYVFY